MAKTDSATLANQKTINDRLLGHIDAIKGISDPAKRARATQLQASQVLNANLARDPQTLQLVQHMASGQYVPTDDDLEGFEAGLVDHNTQIEQRLKTAQTGEATSRGKEADVNTQKAQMEVDLMKTYGFANESQMTAKYLNLSMQK